MLENDVIAGEVIQLFHRHRVLLRALSALASLMLVAGLIAWGLVSDATSSPSPSAVTGSSGDMALYDSIVNRVHNGEAYYPVAVQELRERDYPLRPFVAVRMPTLAWAMAALPDGAARQLGVSILGVMVAMAWAWRLARTEPHVVRFAVALAGLMLGVAPAFVPGSSSFHEVWAGLLIALSLALYRPGAWAVPAVLIGTIAALCRELAAPYLVVMGLMALWERRYREAGAWAGGLAVFALALSAHALKVGDLVTPADPASQGWLQFGGWRFVLLTAKWNLYQLDVSWIDAVLLPLALLGLTGRPRDLRLLLIVVGYTAGFLFVGRDANSYWGFLIAPLWPLGLAMAWPALLQHLTALRAVVQRWTQPSSVPAGTAVAEPVSPSGNG